VPPKICLNGHYFNGEKYGDVCPVCSASTGSESKPSAKPTGQRKPEEYVCAWLVCVAGINKGRAYEIHGGFNFLGNGDGMDLQILGDDRVEAKKHCILVIDERKQQAKIIGGESNGLAYLNGEAVYAATELEHHDVIEIGGGTYLYCSFLSSEFFWN
jgi:hypothetical protein